jgi:ribonuclease HI
MFCHTLVFYPSASWLTRAEWAAYNPRTVRSYAASLTFVWIWESIMTAAGDLTIHTDGASRGNPGAAAFGYIISRAGASPIEEAGCLGVMTNNQAEYTALIRALEHALELGPECGVHVVSDSELMVKQMRGEYRVKNEELRSLYERARELADRFQGKVAFRHVRRGQNKRADALCNEALDGKREPMPRAAPVKQASPKRTMREEILACLQQAGVAAPETVIEQLTAILERYGVRLS